MSLATDSIFVSAIRSNAELMKYIGGRLYTTGIALPDAEAANVPVPYVVVYFVGLSNQDGSKDDEFESDTDTVSIDILVVAKTREDLANTANAVRKTVKDYVARKYREDDNFPLYDYKFSAGKVQMDVRKPCQFQYLHYECDVINDTEDE